MADRNFLLPSLDAVENMYKTLLGRPVVVKRALLIGVPSDLGVAGVYVDGDGAEAVLVYADYKLANGAGAALSMVPVGGVEDANDEKEIPANFFDNFAEVLNVLTVLFNDRHKNAKRARLGGAYIYPDELPEAIASHFGAGDEESRIDTEITIAGGYGGGKFVAILLQ